MISFLIIYSGSAIAKSLHLSVQLRQEGWWKNTDNIGQNTINTERSMFLLQG